MFLRFSSGFFDVSRQVHPLMMMFADKKKPLMAAVRPPNTTELLYLRKEFQKLYTEGCKPFRVISKEAKIDLLLTKNIFVKDGTRCCEEHLNEIGYIKDNDACNITV